MTWGVHKWPYSVHRNNPWYFLTTRPGTILKAKGAIIWRKACFREISGRIQFSFTWRFRIPTVTTQHMPHIFLTMSKNFKLLFFYTHISHGRSVLYITDWSWSSSPQFLLVNGKQLTLRKLSRGKRNLRSSGSGVFATT